MKEIKSIGIITSGGDCGGLNAIINGAARVAKKLGIKLKVIPNGYAGLYNLVNTKEIPDLTCSTRIDQVHSLLAGSEAGHSRVKVKNIKDPNKYEVIKQGLKKFEIDALIISGGDDTGSVVVDLVNHNIPAVHAPKTMDLDLQTYSVGGDSTCNRISQFANELRTTGMSHNRAIVMEVFGRNAGHTALRGGLGADADCILIPEIPVDFDVVYEHYKKIFCQRVIASDVRAGTYLIVVAEGIYAADGSNFTDANAGMDSFGHPRLKGAAKHIRKEIEKRLLKDDEMKQFMKDVGQYVEGLYEVPEIREVDPGHLVRCGFSSTYDVVFGKAVGGGAVKALLDGQTGVTITGVYGDQVRYMKTADAIRQRTVDLAEIPLYEEMDICFGRKAQKYTPMLVEVTGQVWRHL